MGAVLFKRAHRSTQSYRKMVSFWTGAPHPERMTELRWCKMNMNWAADSFWYPPITDLIPPSGTKTATFHERSAYTLNPSGWYFAHLETDIHDLSIGYGGMVPSSLREWVHWSNFRMFSFFSPEQRREHTAGDAVFRIWIVFERVQKSSEENIDADTLIYNLWRAAIGIVCGVSLCVCSTPTPSMRAELFNKLSKLQHIP